MLKIIFLFLFISNSLEQTRSNVYMTKTISPSNMVKMFKLLNITLGKNIGLKVHSGEEGGKYFLTPDFLEEIYNYTNGTYIECNAAYEGSRHTTALHEELLKKHGWTKNNRRFVIMDRDPSEDYTIPVKNPKIIDTNILGGGIQQFDSCIVLAHLKGHPMGGFGGALKQLSIGFASQRGKTWIHTGGNITDWERMDNFTASAENFTAAMGDAASSVVKYFRNRKGIAFINVMSNISLWCDCAGGLAPVPNISDIGILASTDPVALDRACVDLIKKSHDVGRDIWVNQLNELKGENTIDVAEAHGIGTQQYNLILIDPENDDGEGEEETGKQSKATLIVIVVCVVLGVAIFVSIFVFLILRTKPNTKYQEDFHITQKMNE